MKTTLLAIVALAIFVPALCEKCYVCNSQSNPGCKDPFSSSSNIPSYQCGVSGTVSNVWDNLARVFPNININKNPSFSSRDASLCYKVIGKSMNNGGDRDFVVRDCSYFGVQTCDLIKTSVEGLGGQVYECKTCEGDLCNSAPKAVFAGTTALLTGLLVRTIAF